LGEGWCYEFIAAPSVPEETAQLAVEAAKAVCDLPC
jgi:hypothetical protein